MGPGRSVNRSFRGYVRTCQILPEVVILTVCVSKIRWTTTYGGCKVCICASPEIPLSTGNGTCRMSMRAIPATLRHCGVGARPVLCVARCSHSHRQQNKVMKIRGQLRSGAAAQHSLQACSSTVDSTDGSGTGILSGYCPATTHPPPTVLLLLPASKTSVRAATGERVGHDALTGS